MFTLILAAIDGTAEAAAVVEAAARLAENARARLHLLCAIDPGFFLEEPAGAVSRQDEEDYPAPAIEREGADRLVAEAATALRARGLAVTASVEPGEPAETILRTAARLGADGIVMGHRHRSWLGRLGAASVAVAVMEKAVCPLLVVPPGFQPEQIARN